MLTVYNFENNDNVKMPQIYLSGLNIKDDVDQMPRHFLCGFADLI